MGSLMRRGVILDRDGTLNVRPREHEYLASEREFTWLPGAAEALRGLADAGYVLAIASNQRGVARGLVTVETLRAIEERIQRELTVHGCTIEAFRYCFHGDDRCDCRKPKPGMIFALARELGLDLRNSWMVGDSESDVRAGEAAGCKTALIGARPGGISPDIVAASLLEASELITAGTFQRASDGVPGSSADSNSSTSA
jgi:D-glycero-D-manno-heptose 1,7-bisphosphate phosphatase